MALALTVAVSSQAPVLPSDALVQGKMTESQPMKVPALFFFLILIAGPLQAQVLPNDAVVGGKTIADWSAEWWKWVLPISTNHNPFLDRDGAFASIGQPGGHVFLVAYGLGIEPGPYVRSFTVREDQYLFFPVGVFEADNVDTCPRCLTVEQLRDQAADHVSDPIRLFASVDGIEIPNLLAHRVASPVFNIEYTNADNIHSYAFEHPVTGLIDPMVCDGYWLMLEPLSPGLHLLQISCTLRNGHLHSN